jgi:undecaprenyl pyrophosphate phosphatase UppP
MITYFILWVQVLSEMLPISSSTQVELLQQWYARAHGGLPVIIPEGFDYLLHVPLLVVVPLFFAPGWWGPVTMLVQRVWRRERLQSWSTHQLLMIMGKLIGFILVSGIFAEVFHQALKFVGDIALLRPAGLVVTSLLLVAVSFVRSRPFDSRSNNPSTSSGRAGAFAVDQDECGKSEDGSQLGGRDDKKCSWLDINFLHSNTKPCVEKSDYFFPASPEEQRLAASRRVSSGDVKVWNNFSSWHIFWIVGIAQAFAFLPGISRMGATVTVAILCGLSVRRSLEFSFALQYPLVLAAVLLRGLPWLSSAEAATWVQPLLLVHLVVAGVVSYGLLRLAAYLFATRRAWIFGGYVALCAVWLMVG